MHKQEFLAALRNALSGLPQNELEERLTFYEEMIDDRMEEGIPEVQAVAGIGTVDEIRAQVIAEIPLQRLVKEKVKPKRSLRAWEIVLIVLGFPVWGPLLIAAGAIVISLYLVAWALILSLWAVEVSLWAAVLTGLAAAAVQGIKGAIPSALMLLGAAILAAGLSIFMFCGCLAASRGLVRLTRNAGIALKSVLIRKENET